MAPILRCLNERHGSAWTAYQGDCVDVLRQLPDRSVGFSIYSPPFSNLFTYSDSECDMGNSVDDAEFMVHYKFMLKELVRVMRPGRLVAVHCSELPLMKWKHGIIGISDLPGKLIVAHEEAGFILHTRVTVWKDPVVEMQRTKTLGLLYMQLKKDSTRSRVGMPDYALVFRAPGENVYPVGQDEVKFPVSLWQKWASPVWMDINQTNTLNVRQARKSRDERHICPLQLDLIERAMLLWSNPDDVVLSPFMGIGSEGAVAMKLRRKFVGVELREDYWNVACANISEAFGVSGSLLDLAS